MRVSKPEQETIIRWDESSEMAEVYTYNARLQDRFLRFIEKHPDIARQKSEDETGAMCFELPKKSLVVYPAEPPSEQQRQMARDRMLRQHRKNQNSIE